ncbi:MAG TPA: hypothetical protein VMT18_04340, partial [Planctomycetota bacterium]|nr:hypothetical protein [Planctomycetota bacterium]
MPAIGILPILLLTLDGAQAFAAGGADDARTTAAAAAFFRARGAHRIVPLVELVASARPGAGLGPVEDSALDGGAAYLAFLARAAEQGEDPLVVARARFEAARALDRRGRWQEADR